MVIIIYYKRVFFNGFFRFIVFRFERKYVK